MASRRFQSLVAAAALCGAAALLTALPAPAQDRCEPIPAGDWAAKCATRDGRAEIGRLLPEVTALHALREIDTPREACEVLLFGDGVGACDKARRQLLAAALNRASGRLDGNCCVEWRNREVRLGDVLNRHDEDVRGGRSCDEIRDFLAAANRSELVRPCGSGGPTPPPAPSGDCCSPRSKGFWHRQCLGIDRISPGQGGGRGPGLHPAFSREELERILRAADRRIRPQTSSTCEALDEANYDSARGRALAQYAALLLNLEAGFLDGCGRARMEADANRVARLLDVGRFDEAKDLAEAINVGRSVRRCEGSPSDDDEDDDRTGRGKEPKDKDDDRDHPGRGHAYGHDKKKKDK